MKVLYIGSDAITACASFYRDALVELGYDVTTFDPRYFESKNLFQRFSIKALKAPPLGRTEQVKKKLRELFRLQRFDFVFVLAENFFHKEILDEVRNGSSPAPIFFYHSHDNNFSNGILKPRDFWETLSAYDFAFTTKSQNVSRYQAIGQARAFYLPSAFEPRFHCQIPEAKSQFAGRTFPINFIGTYDYSRDKFLKAVGWENLYVWGNGWQRYCDFSKHRDHITPHAIYNEMFGDVMSHTKCALGLLREEAEDRHTQRTFEIPACGALQFAPRNEEILSYFEEGKEIVCFETFEELKEKLDYYLTHETERAALAKAGYQRVTRGGHTYRDRVETMFQIMNKELGTKKLRHAR